MTSTEACDSNEKYSLLLFKLGLYIDLLMSFENRSNRSATEIRNILDRVDTRNVDDDDVEDVEENDFSFSFESIGKRKQEKNPE